jgi:peptidoglycan hydrolase-like protein with peptidoglycan-binding domain
MGIRAVVGRASTVTAVAIGSLAVVATPAHAENTTRNWSANGLVGFCGSASGGVVAAAQAVVFLKTEPNNDSLLIDGQFGQQSYNKVYAFQVQRGLQADGCVGPQTWAALQSGLVTAVPSRHPYQFVRDSLGRLRRYDFSRYGSYCRWTYIHEGGSTEGVRSGNIVSYRYYRFLGGSFATLSPTSANTNCY